MSVPLKINIQTKLIVCNEKVTTKMLNWKREKEVGCDTKCPHMHRYSFSSGISMK